MSDDGSLEAGTRRRRQRVKNVALACGLLALVALFYLVTLVKIGGNGGGG